MKINSIRVAVIALLACTLLQACGGSHYSSGAMTPGPTSPTPQALDTPQVLTATQTTSESDDPIAVNDGSVTVAGGMDETSDPAPAP